MIKVQAKNEAATATASAAAAAAFSSYTTDSLAAMKRSPTVLGLLRLTPNRHRLQNVNMVTDIASVILYAIAYEIYYTVYS